MGRGYEEKIKNEEVKTSSFLKRRVMKNYLTVLKESLQKKESLLIDLIDLSHNQTEIVKKENVDWDEFNKLVELKGEKVEAIVKLDDGFELTYNNVKEELNNNKELYSEDIKNIKELIKSVTEKSASLQALEMRNKTIIEGAFSKARAEIKQSKLGQKAAINYYNKMNQINTIDPQLMDKNC